MLYLFLHYNGLTRTDRWPRRGTDLQETLAKLVSLFRAEISGRDIENSFAAGLSLLFHTVGGTGIRDNNTGGEFRIGIQLKAVFNHMAVFILPAGLSGVNHKTAMGNAAVIPLQLFLADKVDRGVVISEIIGHGLDFLFDPVEIGALLSDNKAFPGMLLSGG